MPFARHGIFPSNKLANDRMPHSLHLIFRNACTVPLGRQSVEIITTEKGGIVEWLFMERGPHFCFCCRLICSNPLTLLAITAPALLLLSVQQVQFSKESWRRERWCQIWRQQKRGPLPIIFFFWGGGWWRRFNVQGAEFSASTVYSTPGVFI